MLLIHPLRRAPLLVGASGRSYQKRAQGEQLVRARPERLILATAIESAPPSIGYRIRYIIRLRSLALASIPIMSKALVFLALAFSCLAPQLATAQVHAPFRWNAQNPKTPITSPGLQFSSCHSARRIPFEFVGNHIYLRARVNGSEPLWFLLDTGATASYFDAQKAKALGLAGQNNSVKGVSMSLRGVRLLDQDFSIRSFGFSAYDGHEMHGMLGYDFINRFVIEIDYENRTVNLYDPKDYKYSGPGEIIPLVMLEDDSGGRIPLVQIKIMQLDRAPIEGKFIADLAVRAAITFNSPFVNSNNLLEAPQKTIQANLGAGAMVRESKQPIGRLPTLQLGHFKIQNPVAIFFQDKEGVMVSPEFDGVIGSEILRRFRVIFDYSRQHVILEPNRYFSEGFEHDMSGMLLVVEGTGFRINQVMGNSPASAAGVHKGDILITVNGKRSPTLTLEQLRRMFLRDGRSYWLGVKRGDRIIQTKISLRRLI